MSGFDLKTPLREAIVTEGLFYDSAQKQNFSAKMEADERKNYEWQEISSEQPKAKREDENSWQ